MRSHRVAILTSVVLSALSSASTVALQDVMSLYGLTTPYSFPFPSKALTSNDADTYITSNWQLSDDKFAWGSQYIQFVTDPSNSNGPLPGRRRDGGHPAVLDERAKSTTTTSSSATAAATSAASNSTSGSSSGTDPAVLRIQYPQGSYSNQTGGTQFYSEPLTANGSTTNALPNTTTNGQFERMLLSYDVFFPAGFGFNQGGKLPGLRGGPDSQGCSGGHQSDGKKCFSTRLMWRNNGMGEAYAYLPPGAKNFCSEQYITCNSDYGTSIGRGSITFVTGKWTTVWLYVALNTVGTRNGVVSLYVNGAQAFYVDDLELRASSAINSIGGLYFSTFFGGFDASWASPSTQYTYFRNITLVGGLGESNATGSKTGAATTAVVVPRTGLIAGVTAGILAVALGFVY